MHSVIYACLEPELVRLDRRFSAHPDLLFNFAIEARLIDGLRKVFDFRCLSLVPAAAFVRVTFRVGQLLGTDLQLMRTNV